MGLRCLLGHDFTEPRTERDREERGEEVVVSITEVKECRRCGETRVISENKEVTSLDQLLEEPRGGAAPPETDAEPVDAGVDPTATPEPDVATEPDGDDPVVPDAEADAGSADGFDHPAADAAADVDAEAGEDAEIIDGESSSGDGTAPAADADDAVDDGAGEVADAAEGERAPGEWPDSEAARRGEGDAPAEAATEWPNADSEGGAAGAEATPSDASHSPAEGESEDVEFLDANGEASAEEGAAAGQARGDVVPDADDPAAAGTAGEDAEFVDGDGPGEWPEQTGEDEGYDAEPDEADDAGVAVDGNLSPRVDGEVADDEDVEFIEADADAAGSAGGSTGGGRAGRSGAASDAGAASGGTGAASPSRQVDLTTTSDRAETAYVCPDCGNRERVGASSMRAGDICPDCKRGYIEERELR